MSTSVDDLEKGIGEPNAALAFCEKQNSLSKEKRNFLQLQNIFFEAIEYKWDHVSKFLIENNMVFINAISPRTGELALMFAASNMHLYTVDLLLERENLQKEMHTLSGNTLIFIDLEKKADSEAFQVMMGAFMQHTSLTTLYISWQNPELIKAVKAMVKVLKTHNVLHNIVLANDEWDAELTMLMIELNQQLKRNHINKKQKNMLEATMKLYLGSIVDTFASDPLKAIVALKAIKAIDVDKEAVDQLSDAPIWNTIEYLRKICMAPYPQNRMKGDSDAAYDFTEQETEDGVIEGVVYFYQNGEPRDEAQGILELSVENEPLDSMRLTAPPITKAAVIKEVYHRIDVEILEQEKKLAKNVKTQQTVTNKSKDSDGNTKNKLKP